MADITTKNKSDLALKTTLDGTEEIVISSSQKVTTQQIADLASGGASGSSSINLYDTIITSQAEFETMIHNSTWNGAINVAIVGVDVSIDGSSYSTADGSVSAGGQLTIPSSVKSITGYNGASLSISVFHSYVGNSSLSAMLGGCGTLSDNFATFLVFENLSLNLSASDDTSARDDYRGFSVFPNYPYVKNCVVNIQTTNRDIVSVGTSLKICDSTISITNTGVGVISLADGYNSIAFNGGVENSYFKITYDNNSNSVTLLNGVNNISGVTIVGTSRKSMASGSVLINNCYNVNNLVFRNFENGTGVGGSSYCISNVLLPYGVGSSFTSVAFSCNYVNEDSIVREAQYI